MQTFDGPKFKLQFPMENIGNLSGQYDYKLQSQVESVTTNVKKNRYYTKEDFLKVCDWKSPRPHKYYERNPNDYVEFVTQQSLLSPNEQFKIEVLTILRGVDIRMASALLHFSDPEIYPIFDFRALYSLGIENPKFNYDLWNDYCKFCQELSYKSGQSIRIIDKALWQFSKNSKK